MKAEVKNVTPAVELRTILRRRWKVAALAFVLPFSAALGLALFLPPVYQARAVVLVEPATEPGATANDLSVRIEQLSRENLARSRLEALIREHHLPVTTAGLRNDIDVQTQRVDQPNGGISVGLTVSVRGRDPSQLAELANVLADYYVDAEEARQKEDSDAAAAELGEVRKQLDEQEGRIKDFDDRNLSELPEQVQLHMASISTLNNELDAIHARQAAVAGRLQGLNHPAPAVTHAAPAEPDVVEPPTATPPDPELAAAEAQLRDLRSRYTDAHPEVIRLRREIAQLRARDIALAVPAAAHSHAARAPEPVVDTHLDADATRAQLNAEAAKLDGQERDLRARVNSAQQAALNAPRRAHERAALLPEVEAARESYAALLKHYQELALASGAGRNPFRFFEEAVPPTSPYAPARPRLLALGMILALLIAGGAVWLAEQLDRTIHSARELRAFSRLPVIGTIPRIASSADHRVATRNVLGVLLAAGSGVAAVLVATWFWASQNDALVRLLIRRGNP